MNRNRTSRLSSSATIGAALLASVFAAGSAAAHADTFAIDSPGAIDRLSRTGDAREVEGSITRESLDRIGSKPPAVVERPAEELCPADFDATGNVSYNDLYMFLNLYFAGHINADMNKDGRLGYSDLFEYIGHFVGGC